ncbi:MAG: hypothetical protein U0441_30485 [Polyangiaceae bacterium]
MRALLVVIAATLAVGCTTSGGGEGGAGSDDITCRDGMPPSRSIACVQSFNPGDGAGYGEDKYPEIIYGEPQGKGTHAGSTDVLSLGKGGTIVVGFGGSDIANGDGPDFIVFENAFYIGDDETKPFKELGEISVSEDGATWSTFPCATAAYPFTGCAGWHAVYAGSGLDYSAYDPATAGGDSFDLADVGLDHARFVKIRDVSNAGAGGSAGFDLDAVTLVNATDR